MDLKKGPGSPEQVECTPPLAVTTLDRGSPNLTGADGARKFGVCWTNRSGAEVRVDVAACN